MLIEHRVCVCDTIILVLIFTLHIYIFRVLYMSHTNWDTNNSIQHTICEDEQKRKSKSERKKKTETEMECMNGTVKQPNAVHIFRQTLCCHSCNIHNIWDCMRFSTALYSLVQLTLRGERLVKLSFE